MKRLLLAVMLSFLALPATAQTPPRPVKLMTLAEGDAGIERRFYGRVRARETVDLAFQVGGQITRLPVMEGQPVAKDTLIARLDLEPFRRNLEQARINLRKVRRDLERLEQLTEANVSEVRLQDARTQVNLAEVSVDEAESRLAHATLNAPFDGLVARRNVANYTTVSAGQPVVRLHDMSEMRVDIDVPEVMFRRAEGGENIDFHATFPGSETRHPLELREFEAETARVGQTFRLTLAFTENPGDWLLPGASATVVAVTELDDTALTVPQTALVFDSDRNPQVMVFEPSESAPDTGTVHLTDVTISIRADGRVELAEGPPSGTEIVMTGGTQLRDGQTVRRFTGLGE